MCAHIINEEVGGQRVWNQSSPSTVGVRGIKLGVSDFLVSAFTLKPSCWPTGDITAIFSTTSLQMLLYMFSLQSFNHYRWEKTLPQNNFYLEQESVNCWPMPSNVCMLFGDRPQLLLVPKTLWNTMPQHVNRTHWVAFSHLSVCLSVWWCGWTQENSLMTRNIPLFWGMDVPTAYPEEPKRRDGSEPQVCVMARCPTSTLQREEVMQTTATRIQSTHSGTKVDLWDRSVYRGCNQPHHIPVNHAQPFNMLSGQINSWQFWRGNAKCCGPR